VLVCLCWGIWVEVDCVEVEEVEFGYWCLCLLGCDFEVDEYDLDFFVVVGVD